MVINRIPREWVDIGREGGFEIWLSPKGILHVSAKSIFRSDAFKKAMGHSIHKHLGRRKQ